MGLQHLRHRIDTMRAARPAAHEAEQPHPTSGPKAMAGNRLIGVFGTGGEMPAGIAHESGKRELIKPDERRAHDPPRRLGPGAGPVSRLSAHWLFKRFLMRIAGCGTSLRAVRHTVTQLIDP